MKVFMSFMTDAYRYFIQQKLYMKIPMKISMKIPIIENMMICIQ